MILFNVSKVSAKTRGPGLMTEIEFVSTNVGALQPCPKLHFFPPWSLKDIVDRDAYCASITHKAEAMRKATLWRKLAWLIYLSVHLIWE